MSALPFDKKFIEEISKKYPTPFYIYDESQLIQRAQILGNAYSWSNHYKNYFAVKANPNPYVLKILKTLGMGVDCSSLPELLLAEKAGFVGEDIIFSSNNTPWEEYQKATKLGAIINFDDISHIEYFEKNVGKLPEIVSFRYNPGPRRAHGNEIIGHPEEAKYGLTYEQIFEAYTKIKERGVKRFGIHTMVVSNELSIDAHAETASMMFEIMNEITEKLDIHFEFINLGGGYGVPYRPTDKAIDINQLSSRIKSLYDEAFKSVNSKPIIIMEHGRYVAAPAGYFITKVRHMKHTYKDYVGVDASITNFFRIAVNQGFHEVTVLGKEGQENSLTYDVVGSLCENNDKFAIDRKLPKIEVGDILVIHNAGGHGYALTSNYNGKLRPAELLFRDNGEILQIRRAETVDDYFATLDFSGLVDFK